MGPRPEPDLPPEEHSESATRGLWLSGQRRTKVPGQGQSSPGGVLSAFGPQHKRRSCEGVLQEINVSSAIPIS